MIYKSNLVCPALRQYFKLKTPSLEMMGHDIPSDPDFDPNCGYWSDDEAAILFHAARQVGGYWVDLGARFGWTTAHVASARADQVIAVDREYSKDIFRERAEANLAFARGVRFHESTAQLFLTTRLSGSRYDGFVIDADHDEPQPMLDAIGCERIANPDAVILMHDFWGRPIQDAVTALMDHGWRCRIYNTPNGVALLWRGYRCDGGGPCLHPPNHSPDPAINWAEVRRWRAEGFSFERTE